MSCARREEGRPVFWATTLDAAGAATGADLVAAVVMGADTFSGGAGLAAGLLATAGFRGTAGAGALAALTGSDTAGLAAGLAAGFTAGFAATLGAGLAGATAAGLAAVVAADFTGALGLSATAGLAAALGADLAGALTGVATALTEALGLAAATLDLGSFPGLAFTWSLLVELAGGSCVALWFPRGAFEGLACGVSSARECTGFAIGKPMSCKIETIIPLPAIVEPPFKTSCPFQAA